jgi:hypothetical protein
MKKYLFFLGLGVILFSCTAVQPEYQCLCDAVGPNDTVEDKRMDVGGLKFESAAEAQSYCKSTYEGDTYTDDWDQIERDVCCCEAKKVE